MLPGDFLAGLEEDSSDLEEPLRRHQKQSSAILWVRLADERSGCNHIVDMSGNGHITGKGFEISGYLLYRQYFTLKPFMSDQRENHIGFKYTAPPALKKPDFDHLTSKFSPIFEPGYIGRQYSFLLQIQRYVGAFFNRKRIIKLTLFSVL